MRHGVDEELAHEIDIAAYNDEEHGIIHVTDWMDDEEHDYSGEFVQMYRDWQVEVGEREADDGSDVQCG